MKKIGFIGCGNMGAALIAAACNGNVASDVIITDYFIEKAEVLAGKFGCCVAETNEEIVRESEIIMLGVVPQVLGNVLNELAPILKEYADNGKERILVSMAAGITVETIKNYLGNIKMPIIRIMPNTPVAIGKGIILLTSDARFPGEVSEEVFNNFTTVMSAAGIFDKVEENKIDEATVATGCIPAFVYMFIEGLADGAVMAGVPRDKAYKYSAQALLGAASMVLETGEHPGKLKDDVCSPGGSTIVGVAELEKNGLRNTAIQAVMASYYKNIELGNSNKNHK